MAIAGRISDDDNLMQFVNLHAGRFMNADEFDNATVTYSTAGLALAAFHLSDGRIAKECYEILKSQFGSFIAFRSISGDRILGLLSQTVGDFGQSGLHFDDAIKFCRRTAHRPELAWSLCDCADMLLERNEDGDKDKATAMLDESLAISTELGMRPLMERVLSRREILKAQLEGDSDEIRRQSCADKW